MVRISRIAEFFNAKQSRQINIADAIIATVNNRHEIFSQGVEQAIRILPTVAGLSKTKSDGKLASARADLMALLIAKNTAQLSNSGGSPIP